LEKFATPHVKNPSRKYRVVHQNFLLASFSLQDPIRKPRPRSNRRLTGAVAGSLTLDRLHSMEKGHVVWTILAVLQQSSRSLQLQFYYFSAIQCSTTRDVDIELHGPKGRLSHLTEWIDPLGLYHGYLHSPPGVPTSGLCPKVLFPWASCSRSGQDEDNDFSNRPGARVSRLSYSSCITQPAI
jgi:hypothetical protein